MLFKIFTFVLTILILVSLHELGHLIVARMCKVKVIRYCIGFGKPMFVKVFKGIEWAIAPIPLGGYVKMLDTREGLVAPEELQFAFDKQHPCKKILIAAAGPFANLLLAFVICFFIFSFRPIPEAKPMIGTVIEGSIAHKVGFKAGDTILQINNKHIDSLSTMAFILFTQLDTQDKVYVDILDEHEHFRKITINTIDYKNEIKQLFKKATLGILADKYTPIINKVQRGSVADTSGFKTGDKLVSINGVPINNWVDFTRIIKNNGGKKLNIGIIRTINDSKQVKHNINITPSIIKDNNGTKTHGEIGISPSIDNVWAKKIYSYNKLSVAGDVLKTIKTIWFYSKMIIQFIIDFISGKASIDNISGPVGMANVTSQYLQLGIVEYLHIIALLSINLGILNILPIPLLDGGHILYYTIEWIKGSPLSEKAQAFGLKFGMTIVFLMMLIAFFNDFKNIFG